MPNITKYQPSAHHEKSVRKAGFDVTDPDRRYPVHNPEAEKILAERGNALTSRGQALLNARGGMIKARDRAMGLAAFIILALNTDASWARGYAPLAKIPVKKTEPEPVIQLLPVEMIPDAFESMWIAALLIALILSTLFSHSLQISELLTLKRIHAMLKTNDDHQEPNEGAASSETRDRDDAPVTAEAEVEVVAGLPEPVSNKNWSVTGASRLGKVRSENQDAFATHQVGPKQQILVLCDGAGGHAGGKEAAVVASQTILSVLKSPVSDVDWVSSTIRLEEAIEIARKEFASLELEGVTTAIVALLDDDWLHYATLGDGGLSLVWPSGMITEALTPHHQRGRPSNQIGGFIGHNCEVPPRVGSVKLEEGVTVFLMSDGASDLFDLEFYADNREKFSAFLASGMKGLADRFLDQLEQARDEKSGAYLHQDNMTMILAHLSNEEGKEHG